MPGHASRVAVLLLFFISTSGAYARERSLYWRSLEVHAQLDRDGHLHVTERHRYIFTGDWNGGERVFRLQLQQTIRLDGLNRIDPSGAAHPLAAGDLSSVDQYKWTDSKTLRWRSRLPSDQPFDATELDYDLRYTLFHTLVPQSDGYLLDHDFAFPNRDGRIEKYSLDFEIDPPWQPGRRIAQHYEAGPLNPGESYLITIPLRYVGRDRPAGVIFGAGPVVRSVVTAALAACLVLFSILFYKRERSVGRFAPLTPSSAINEAWLSDNVLFLPPEVVGAAWDEEVGAPEVAAVLARMVSEKKIRSEIKKVRSRLRKKDVLHMDLLVHRDMLAGYEKDLVNSLFFSGDTTDTESIRKHYQNRGFNPSNKIRGPLNKQVNAVASSRSKSSKPTWKISLGLMLAGLILVALACVLRSDESLIAAAAGSIGIAGYVAAIFLAMSWQHRIHNLGLSSLLFIAPLLLLTVVPAGFLLTGRYNSSAWLLAGLAMLCAAAVNSVLNAARTRDTAEKIGFRKKLAAAREYFRKELRRPNPELKDAWFPYLIAFGLGSRVDRWFKAYGKTISSGGSDISLAGYSGSSPSGWTGGGGSFGGAGASASWAAAAGAIASGVAAPSSGSGGGGGGSSSGGGGGGGW